MDKRNLKSAVVKDGINESIQNKRNNNEKCFGTRNKVIKQRNNEKCFGTRNKEIKNKEITKSALALETKIKKKKK